MGAFQMKILFSTILFLILVFPLFSEEADSRPKNLSKKDKAMMAVELSRIHETYITTLLSTVRQSSIPEQDKKLFQKYATPESLMELFIPVYIEMYSDEELDAMIEFYSSPAGKSIISKSQDVINRLREINFDWQNVISEKVRKEKAGENTNP